jgi:hypothetical protein
MVLRWAVLSKSPRNLPKHSETGVLLIAQVQLYAILHEQSEIRSPGHAFSRHTKWRPLGSLKPNEKLDFNRLRLLARETANEGWQVRQARPEIKALFEAGHSRRTSGSG